MPEEPTTCGDPEAPSFPEDLFEGLTAQQRDERLVLLRWLSERGVGLDALREAIRERRLALLPTEIILTRGCRYSRREAADTSGLRGEFIARAWRAAGIAVPPDDEPLLDDEDLDAVKLAKQVIDAGVTEDAYTDISRVVGRGAAPIAEALIQISVERFLESDQSEEEFAMRLEETAERLTPLLPFLLAFPVRMHLRAAVRNHALERREEGVMALTGTRHMATGFVDIVGFTALSEDLSVRESGSIADRLERLAADVAEPPVRLVKLIGDAAMLVSEDPQALVGALIKLRRLAEEENDFPGLRMGAASGDVAARAGDVYGRSVNLASRLADLAEPGQLLVASELAEALRADAFETRRLPKRQVKGVGAYQPIEIRAPT